MQTISVLFYPGFEMPNFQISTLEVDGKFICPEKMLLENILSE